VCDRYFQDAEAALIVYDVTFRPSFDAAKRWVEDLRTNSNVAELTLAIVGNKSDQMGEAYAVQLQEAHEFAGQCRAEIVKETSARDNSGIQELFQLIAAKLIKKAKAKQVRE
jgi:GTPase SAR1 family protein